jgi:hypothetical protein
LKNSATPGKSGKQPKNSPIQGLGKTKSGRKTTESGGVFSVSTFVFAKNPSKKAEKSLLHALSALAVTKITTKSPFSKFQLSIIN